MDKEERGRLLADEEELEKKVNQQKQTLSRYGKFLRELGMALEKWPEQTAIDGQIMKSFFKDRKDFFLAELPPDFVDGKKIAAMLNDLREDMERLHDVQMKLRLENRKRSGEAL